MSNTAMSHAIHETGVSRIVTSSDAVRRKPLAGRTLDLCVKVSGGGAGEALQIERSELGMQKQVQLTGRT